MWEPWLLLSNLSQQSPVGGCNCSISWTLLCSSQLPAYGYFSRRGSLKCPVCNDHIINLILWVASVCTRTQTKGCPSDKVNREAICDMNSYHKIQLSRGSIYTSLRNIDPFWFHDMANSLELGYLSSGVEERRNTFRLIEAPFWGQWQVYIMVIQTISTHVPASCGSAFRPFWREMISRAIYYRGLVTGGLWTKSMPNINWLTQGILSVPAPSLGLGDTLRNNTHAAGSLIKLYLHLYF